MDERHRHAAMVSTRGSAGKAEQVTQVSSFKADMELNDARSTSFPKRGGTARPR